MVWGPMHWGPARILNYPPPDVNIDVRARAVSDTMTVFFLVDHPQSTGDNLIFIDALALYPDESAPAAAAPPPTDTPTPAPVVIAAASAHGHTRADGQPHAAAHGHGDTVTHTDGDAHVHAVAVADLHTHMDAAAHGDGGLQRLQCGPGRAAGRGG
ncbi:MAG: hypothetical protein R2854_12535 [Caldilineaceae bacterium]